MFSPSEKKVFIDINNKEEINNYEVYFLLNGMTITHHEVINNKFILITYVER